jgi:hypothetical protein
VRGGGGGAGRGGRGPCARASRRAIGAEDYRTTPAIIVSNAITARTRGWRAPDLEVDASTAKSVNRLALPSPPPTPPPPPPPPASPSGRAVRVAGGFCRRCRFILRLLSCPLLSPAPPGHALDPPCALLYRRIGLIVARRSGKSGGSSAD